MGATTAARIGEGEPVEATTGTGADCCADGVELAGNVDGAGVGAEGAPASGAAATTAACGGTDSVADELGGDEVTAGVGTVPDEATTAGVPGAEDRGTGEVGGGRVGPAGGKFATATGVVAAGEEGAVAVKVGADGADPTDTTVTTGAAGTIAAGCDDTTGGATGAALRTELEAGTPVAGFATSATGAPAVGAG